MYPDTASDNLNNKPKMQEYAEYLYKNTVIYAIL